jgi:hypothetical protein
MWALRTTVKYLPRIAKDRGDHEARSQMLYVLPTQFRNQRSDFKPASRPLSLVLASEMLVCTCAME